MAWRERDLRSNLQRLPCIPNPLHTLEILRPIHQPPLAIYPPVDEIRIIECQLRRAIHNTVRRFDTQHETVILIPDLVSPATEPSAGVNVHVLEFGEELFEDALTLERRRWVAVIEAAVVGRDDLVGGFEHVGVEEALDRAFEEGRGVDGFEARFRDFDHDGPVRARLGGGIIWYGAIGELLGGEFDVVGRLVVGGVVAEDGGAVEGAVILGEVEPALVADAFGARAADADADDVGGGVEEAFAEGGELLVLHLLDKGIDAHCGDEFLVFDRLAVFEGHTLSGSVHLGDGTILAVDAFFLGESVCNGDPDTACAAMGREAEGGIWTPVAGCFLEDHVLGDGLEIWGSDTFTKPLTLHLFCHGQQLMKKAYGSRIPLLWVRPRP